MYLIKDFIHDEYDLRKERKSKDYYEEEEDFVIVESKKTEKEYEEGVRSIKLENNVNRVELIEEEEDDEDQFDLRQAIIYSEIINRKEF